MSDSNPSARLERTSLIVRDRITTVGARAYNVILRAFRAAVSQALLKIEVAVLLARSEVELPRFDGRCWACG